MLKTGQVNAPQLFIVIPLIKNNIRPENQGEKMT
jgi:hypothetical protein